MWKQMEIGRKSLNIMQWNKLHLEQGNIVATSEKRFISVAEQCELLPW